MFSNPDKAVQDKNYILNQSIQIGNFYLISGRETELGKPSRLLFAPKFAMLFDKICHKLMSFRTFIYNSVPSMLPNGFVFGLAYVTQMKWFSTISLPIW